MQIGPYPLSNNLILAPMAGVTDQPFRRLCRRFGAALAVSEMVTADTALWGSGKSLRRLDHVGEEPPVSVQIVGADPARIAEAARRNLELGARIIDINMGCPAKKVCRMAAGSALMRDPDLVRRILDAAVGAVAAPVTLKIRTGWDLQHRNAVEIARIAEDAGIRALAIHGRTRADKFAGAAEYATIRAVKRAVSIPVIANGDIDSAEKAQRVLDTTGADAVMIGRAARGRPWIFEEILHWQRTGLAAPPRSPREIAMILLEHLDTLYSFYGREHGVKVARKHIGWYARRQPRATEFRERAFRAETPEGQQQTIRDFFAETGNYGKLAA
ncbi:MAG: tRNA dihydrouridine synthase DusB [Pseudomonadota bacterium]